MAHRGRAVDHAEGVTLPIQTAFQPPCERKMELAAGIWFIAIGILSVYWGYQKRYKLPADKFWDDLFGDGAASLVSKFMGSVIILFGAGVIIYSLL